MSVQNQSECEHLRDNIWNKYVRRETEEMIEFISRAEEAPQEIMCRG